LEEVGTGGSGFRYMYAAFLQESAQILKMEKLSVLSEEMTIVAHRWRDFTYHAAIQLKSDEIKKDIFYTLSEIIMDCMEKEKNIHRKLSKIF